MTSEQPDAVIPPPPQQVAEFHAIGRALAVGSDAVAVVTIDLTLTDGQTVSMMTTDQGVGLLLDSLREAQRDARRMARLAQTRKANP